MLFPTYVFLLFFLPVVLILYYIIFRNNLKLQNYALLFSSLFFYSWGEPVFVFAMVGCIFVNWGFGYLCTLHKEDKLKFPLKIAFIITIVADLSLLAIYKYIDFIIVNINRLPWFDIPLTNIALPIGISFFVFQAISYTVDVYRGSVMPQKKLPHIALYIALFPQVVAGPIVRYQTIEKELDSRKFCWDDFSSGLRRFIIGLGKKVIIADTIALAADYAFSKSPGGLSVSAAWIGAAAYALQIYFDFSGYSDMAIGLGKMFGFHFLENFNFPYISRSISEFWRRWHISLSSWFRDYVYFPLGGSRVKSKARLIFNLFVVWCLTGVWHGASWTFIAWGLMFFVLIAFEKVTGFGKVIEKIPVAANVYTLFFVLLGWVLFRSPGGHHALDYLLSMFGFNGNAFINIDAYFMMIEYSFTWIIGIVGSVGIFKLFSKINMPTMIRDIGKWVYISMIFALSLAHISGSNYSPFVYFNF